VTTECNDSPHLCQNGAMDRGKLAYLVFSQPMDRVMAAIIPHAKTDEAGYFAIPHSWLGKFAVGAEKLDEDYPNMTMQFYSDGKLETVILTSAHSAANRQHSTRT
jgi:hypothetical protein